MTYSHTGYKDGYKKAIKEVLEMIADYRTGKIKNIYQLVSAIKNLEEKNEILSRPKGRSILN